MPPAAILLAGSVIAGWPIAAAAQAACCAPPPVPSRQACLTEGCRRLGAEGWAILSGELRVRGEAFDRPDFGIADSDRFEAIARRLLVKAEIVPRPGWRAVAELSAAGVSGRRPRPFDQSAPDLAQMFLDVPVRVGTVRATMRAGRQELALGNRLVALRDGVTLRRAFDGVRIDVAAGGVDSTMFVASPVDNRDGAFDDRRTAGERFAGFVFGRGTPTASGRWTLFLLDRKRRGARYASVTGDERRQTWGVGYARSGHALDATVQAAWQGGDIAGQEVSAWGGAMELGWRPQPSTRLGIALGYASGDASPASGKLTTFDPLYPNLGAFTDAPLSYYANQIDAQVNLRHTIGAVSIKADATMLARARREDALYTAPGRPLALSQGGALSALAFEAGLRWRVAPRAELQASILRAEALGGVRAAGGRDTTFAMLQMTQGF